ncbi:OmpA family protein [Nostoc sp. NIES-2111]
MRRIILAAGLLGTAPAFAANIPNVATFIVALRPGEILALGKGEIVPLGGGALQMTVQETPAELRIRLPADILFDFDKAVLRPSAAPALAQAADLVRQNPASVVTIEGHTDSKGKEDYNTRLSLRRAEAVRSYLAQAATLNPNKVKVNAYAARRPVAPNTKPDGSDDPEGRQLNRRVEIVLAR